MKIVLINTFDRKGGAGIACYRLMEALRKSGNSVKMLVREKQDHDPDVVDTGNSWMRRKLNFLNFLWERFIIWIHTGFSRKNLFAVSLADTGIDVSEHPLVQEADIIHLHWINQGFLSLKTVEKLVRLNKPVVWTMHDMWPCTGICHHARDCENYKQNCGNCFFLKHQGKKDLSFVVFEKKKKIDYGKIVFVACSRWLQRKAVEGRLLHHARVEQIPNPLNTDIFSPGDKKEAKRNLSMDEDKFILLFGAANVLDPRKGFEYYFEALKKLNDIYPDLSAKIELVFMGEAGLILPAEVPFRAYFTGYLSGAQDVVCWYRAADMFVIPSLEENLPNMIMEAMACGVPVVGFDTGGIPEMIDHRENGYVARYKDSDDLMNGIYWVLCQADAKALAEKARKKVMDCFSEETVGRRFCQLYVGLIGAKGSGCKV